MAIQLGDLDTAHTIALSLDSAPKWKQLGELAMSSGRLEVAEKCLSNAKDFSGLMLLYAAQVRRAWWSRCKGRARGKVQGWLGHPSSQQSPTNTAQTLAHSQLSCKC